ncbi:MAG: hypothetical protein LBL00_03940 [Endomicrobium sp.]|jgi:hypothetical protein|nr:hypothetical protein [Endomicrobium sp.]
MSEFYKRYKKQSSQVCFCIGLTTILRFEAGKKAAFEVLWRLYLSLQAFAGEYLRTATAKQRQRRLPRAFAGGILKRRR